MKLSLSDICVQIGDACAKPIIDGLSLTIEDGARVAIVGPSGCGKSTLLNAIAGLRDLTRGTISFSKAGQAKTPRTPIAFQEPSLFPWLTAFDNAVLAAQARGVGRAAREESARHYFDRFGLANAQHLYPRQLSGGMRQRVSLIRLLLGDGDVLLCDEPLSALDAHLRLHIQNVLRDIWDEQKATLLYVTHDIEEALFMADRVIVLGSGAAVLADLDVPETIRNAPIETPNPERDALRWHIWSMLPRPAELKANA